MKELGEYLKETRVKHGVSIDEAADDLNITSSQLENVEVGNVRAFQDVYHLKEIVRNYAKYLGLDPDKVLDEFNDFLFEHTSKISLNDILEADKKRKEKEQEKPKVLSPYTKKRKEKGINVAPFVLISLIMVLLVLIIYLLIKEIGDERKIDTELKENIVSKEEFYEFTY